MGRDIYQPAAPQRTARGPHALSGQVSVPCDWEGLAGCPRQTRLQGGAPPKLLLCCSTTGVRARGIKEAPLPSPPLPPRLDRRGRCRRSTCCRGAPTRSVAGSPPGRQCSGICWAGSLRKKVHRGAGPASPPPPRPPHRKAASPPWEQRNVWLVMGPGSAKVLNLLSHSRDT